MALDKSDLVEYIVVKSVTVEKARGKGTQKIVPPQKGEPRVLKHTNVGLPGKVTLIEGTFVYRTTQMELKQMLKEGKLKKRQ